MWRACSKCGRIHAFNYKCNNGIKKDYSKYDYEESRLRNTYKWHKKAEQIKKDSNYLCSVCIENKTYNYNDLEVHHIIKIKDDKSKLLDDNNLICLCEKHHKLADAGMIDEEYLFSLVKKRLQKLI